ncbi:MAG: LPS export ABC transporter periplasmic protein LptC [Burkholderiales bacterium]|nr:LPS export ABC transporter periplasmic protein LptC [Burkholderiales bacterium]
MNADRIRVWLLVTIMGLIMLGSFWVYEVMRRNAELAAASNQVRSAPDYFVEQFNFVRLSQSGKTNYRVTGEKLTHFPKEDEFEIIQPRIVGIDQEQTPMNIRADRAVIKQKVKEDGQAKPEDQIHMLGNVLVERSSAKGQAALKLETEALILFPDSERMRTDAPVVMTTANAVLNTLGLEANNTTQQITFPGRTKMVIDNAHLQKADATTNSKAQPPRRQLRK